MLSKICILYCLVLLNSILFNFACFDEVQQVVTPKDPVPGHISTTAHKPILFNGAV